MPLVLTQNEQSAADVEYADQLGVSYEFPAMYKNRIQPGEPFIYYRGKRKTGTGIQVPHYFGIGTVWQVSPASKGKLRCVIEDYRAFDSAVPFKQDGRYLEPGANERPSRLVGTFFQQGVRKIDQTAFDEICGLGLLSSVKRTASSSAQTKLKEAKSTIRSAGDEMNDLAMRLAVAEAKDQWPAAKIFRAPAGQYFSIIVRHPDGEKHHIAVKATDDDETRVRLSDGEVSYAKTHASTYSLWVFYAIDLPEGTARLIKRKGRITEDDIDLAAAVHGGRLKNTTAGKKVGPISG